MTYLGRAIEDVRRVANMLEEALEDLEEAVAVLEIAEREKKVVDREVESLRGAVAALQRQRQLDKQREVLLRQQMAQLRGNRGPSHGGRPAGGSAAQRPVQRLEEEDAAAPEAPGGGSDPHPAEDTEPPRLAEDEAPIPRDPDDERATH